MPIIIRKMSINDIDEVMLIENESFASPWTKESLLNELLHNEFSVILVAIIDDIIVGFLNFWITFSSATICQIATKKEYRNRGVAQKLLDEMYAILLTNEDVETITLEVRKTNIAAHSLYIKNLFKDVVVKPHYYSDGEDAIYMCKEFILCRQF